MIQDQLVDYITSQMKAGVSRDAIKTSLVGAGWQVADVEDTFKKVEGATTGAVTSGSPTMLASNTSSTGPAKSEPQTIRVNDLVSASEFSSTTVKPMTSIKPTSVAPAKTASQKSAPAMTQYSAKTQNSRGPLIIEVILVIIIIVVGAFAGYLFMQNTSLSGKVDALTSSSATLTSELSSLQQQIGVATTTEVGASTTESSTQVASLMAENQELMLELSFYAEPLSPSLDVTTSTMVSGTVSGSGKTLYVITTQYGAQVYVSNSKDTSVIAAVAPLVGSTTTAQFTGTYTPGAQSMTVTAVNGTSVK